MHTVHFLIMQPSWFKCVFRQDYVNDTGVGWGWGWEWGVGLCNFVPLYTFVDLIGLVL